MRVMKTVSREDDFISREDIFISREDDFISREDIFISRETVFISREMGFTFRWPNLTFDEAASLSARNTVNRTVRPSPGSLLNDSTEKYKKKQPHVFFTRH
ncbi:MAG: hypothetical protein LBS42_08175 [Tannerella sp.]|jgi:hypothetical protein|nr:hypothetical protein [Tannerella sp.]